MESTGLSVSLLESGALALCERHLRPICTDAPEIADGDEPFIEEGYEVDDAITSFGNGPFQALLVSCIFFVWSFNSGVTMVTPFFISGMRKDMGLSPEQANHRYDYCQLWLCIPTNSHTNIRKSVVIVHSLPLPCAGGNDSCCTSSWLHRW